MIRLLTLMIWMVGTLVAAEECVHQSGQIRIFYHTEGPHAVDSTDTNTNGIPDQVEDIMTQTQAARAMFVEVLGFPDPLKTERFRTASFIDIHLRRKEILKSNGVAFDELQRYRKPGDPDGTLSIGFNVATSVKATLNLTPAHEFFHLIQYSTTYFKNRWFLEGTARWSERALGAGDLGPTRILSAWPLPMERKTNIAGMAYEASEHLWNPLAAKSDGDSELPECAALDRIKATRYVNGTPVLKDQQFKGWQFVRDVLQELAKEDDLAFAAFGYDRWSEENQRSPQNEPFIWKAVEDVMARHAAIGE